MHTDHSRISPTAKLVAWWRAKTDIPWAAEVAEYSKALETVESMLSKLGVDSHETLWGAPILEMRYKSLISQIRQSGVHQVLELASGLALRGLAMTEDENLFYIETDLPEITKEKIAIVERITGKPANSIRRNLIFASANALNWDELAEVIKRFQPEQPVAIVHEGLVHYLHRPEIERLTENIRRILNRHGGIWLTPDFEFREHRENMRSIAPRAERVFKAIGEATGRELMSDAFTTEGEFQDFMSSEGFSCARIKQFDGSYHLSSATVSGLPETVLDTLKSYLTLWRIKLEK
jgi:O-methyltransferase involved in polyketide biosynthesis